MRIVFTGGGTAGHITPALALADTVKNAYPDADICFYGGERGLERELVTRAGYPFYGFCVEGLKRSFTLKNLRVLYHAAQAYRTAKRKLSEHPTALVVGTGGYVCWPVLQAAFALGIPTALHESNAVLGFAARSLVKKVDLMLVNHAETIPLCKGAKSVHCVGNPIRSDFTSLPKQQAKASLKLPANSKLILSFGGSLGAHALNHAILDVMHSFSLPHENIYHVHVTGKRGHAAFWEDPRASALVGQARTVIHDYLYDLPRYLSAADIVISRAGAMTLSEIALTETPAILIPSPNVTGDHQTKNATVFEKAGAAKVLPERSLTGKQLSETLSEILFDPYCYHKMRSAVKTLATPHANREILSLLSQFL